MIPSLKTSRGDRALYTKAYLEHGPPLSHRTCSTTKVPLRALERLSSFLALMDTHLRFAARGAGTLVRAQVLLPDIISKVPVILCLEALVLGQRARIGPPGADASPPPRGQHCGLGQSYEVGPSPGHPLSPDAAATAEDTRSVGQSLTGNRLGISLREPTLD
jgi:hypothetical protein